MYLKLEIAVLSKKGNFMFLIRLPTNIEFFGCNSRCVTMRKKNNMQYGSSQLTTTCRNIIDSLNVFEVPLCTN